MILSLNYLDLQFLSNNQSVVRVMCYGLVSGSVLCASRTRWEVDYAKDSCSETNCGHIFGSLWIGFNYLWVLFSLFSFPCHPLEQKWNDKISISVSFVELLLMFALKFIWILRQFIRFHVNNSVLKFLLCLYQYIKILINSIKLIVLFL